MEKAKRRIQFPRQLLLVEIERRCSDPACNARVTVGLTKEEARTFNGFECERCELWSEDVLTERDVPEWWGELAIASLTGGKHSSEEAYAPSEVAERLSAAYRQQQAANEDYNGDGDEQT